ncbi:MAG TPA: tripartite tricarboxylate transporter substrate binding protein [Xanthobacteraceae bacterium]|nr:tripartite tricarboxylate transporter substrate binding protein [Xanthobacteraceae bacterium]
MNRREIVRLMGASAAALAVVAARDARAQEDAKNYPNRAIRLIVGFAAGGGNDIFARLVGQKLQESIGQSVVIENRPGAGGRLAAAYVAGQPPDGYTLLVGAAGAMSIAPAIYPNLPYHPLRSFVPLTLIGSFPLVLTVTAKHEVKTVAELVDWAKAHPDRANYATSAPGFTIATELLKLKTGMPGVAIPYKSSNESVLSVISGQTLLTIADPPPTVPLVKGGQLRALAVTGARRLAELPEVPSMAEAGLPEVNIGLWSGLFAPAGTPPAIAQKLETELRRAILSPAVADKLKALGVDPGGIPADALRRLIEADIKLTADVVKAANLTFEE